MHDFEVVVIVNAGLWVGSQFKRVFRHELIWRSRQPFQTATNSPIGN